MTNDQKDDSQAGSAPGQERAVTFWRIVSAICVGFIGSVIIWVVTPYNNFILRLGYISDSYLPIAALFVLMLLVLGINPALRRLGIRHVLNRFQMGLVLAMLLMASVIPGQGLLRIFPYSLASMSLQMSQSRQISDAYADAGLPAALFPEKLEYEAPVPAAESLIGQLLPGQSIPWGAWLMPFLSWGLFLGLLGMMMVGMSMIVLPQWQRNERLAFPLLEVQNSLIETPSPGHAFAEIFRCRAFWIGSGLVFVLYLLYGFNKFYPETVPAIPLEWDLRRCFTEDPWRYLPASIYRSRIYFLFVAIAFFMPSRISFSIWAMTLIYALYYMAGRAWFPPFHYTTISDHRSGAMLTLTLVILWLGRARWLQIGRAIVRRPTTVGQDRDRMAGLMFLVGIAGSFAWMVWAGCQPGWALLYIAIGFMVCLLVTRLVAETGIPFLRIYDCQPFLFMRLLPVSWLGAGSVFMGGMIHMFFQLGSRVNGMTMATHALALDDTPGAERRQNRFGYLLIAVLLLGLLISGAAHLYNSYNHSVTLDGQQSPISPWGYTMLNGTHNVLLAKGRGQLPQPLYNQTGHIAFGAAVAGVLQWASMAMPNWPLHPIGLLMVHTFYGNEAWTGIFLGWLLKVLIVRYGGSGLYRRAKPLFIGLIIGEVFAAAFWCLVPFIYVLMGKPYVAFPLQPM